MKIGWNRGLEYLSYILVFVTPLLYFGGNFFIPYSTSKLFFFYGVVEIMAAVWLYLIFKDKKYRPSKNVLYLTVPFLTWIIWLSITALSGVSFELSFWSSLMRGTGLLTLYHGAALSFIIVSLIKVGGGKYLRSLLSWFLAAASIVSLSVWLGDEGFNLPFEFLQKSKGGGLIGNSSLAASYLLFALFFGLLVLVLKDVSRRLKIWTGLVLLTIIFSPLFLNLYDLITIQKFSISARGAMLGLVFGLLAAALVWLSLSKKRLVKYIGVAGLLISLIIFAVGRWNFVTPDTLIHEKFAQSASGSRFIFWDIAEQGIAEHPIRGWGLENYSVVYQKYFSLEILKQSDTTAEVWVDRPHNVFYELGVAGGYPAMILYFLFIVSLLYGSHCSYRLERATRLQASILIGLVFGYVLQNLFVFDSLSSLLGLFILSAVIYGLNEPPAATNSKPVSRSRHLPIILSLITIGLIFSLTFFVVRPSLKVLKISEVSSLAFNKRFDHYKDLLSISPIGDGWEIGSIAEDAYKLYVGNLEKVKNDKVLFALAKQDLEKLLEYLNIIAGTHPTDYRLNLHLIRLTKIYMNLYGLNEDPIFTERISTLAKHTRSLSPNHFDSIFMIKNKVL